MRAGDRVLPREDSGDFCEHEASFWDRVVGYSFWFTAGAISVLVWLDLV